MAFNPLRGFLDWWREALGGAAVNAAPLSPTSGPPADRRGASGPDGPHGPLTDDEAEGDVGGGEGGAGDGAGDGGGGDGGGGGD